MCLNKTAEVSYQPDLNMWRWTYHILACIKKKNCFSSPYIVKWNIVYSIHNIWPIVYQARSYLWAIAYQFARAAICFCQFLTTWHNTYSTCTECDMCYMSLNRKGWTSVGCFEHVPEQVQSSIIHMYHSCNLGWIHGQEALENVCVRGGSLVLMNKKT